VRIASMLPLLSLPIRFLAPHSSFHLFICMRSQARTHILAYTIDLPEQGKASQVQYRDSTSSSLFRNTFTFQIFLFSSHLLYIQYIQYLTPILNVYISTVSEKLIYGNLVHGIPIAEGGDILQNG
jgi:hypothetical protein